MSAATLVRVLRAPRSATLLSPAQWTDLLCTARAERLLGTLAMRLMEADVAVPERASRVLVDGLGDAEREQQLALWEADRCAAALGPAQVPFILLKGGAYAALGNGAARGRMVGDLDILVPRDLLHDAETALLAAGWEWVKPDPYDDAYYRRWMHELPPLIHRERDRMIDVHHTILPLTAGPRPNAAAMIARAVPVSGGFFVLAPLDRLCHAAAHLIADGDLGGGLRNLWDVHCLLAEGVDRAALVDCAAGHGLGAAVARAVRLADHLYGSGSALTVSDRLFVRRLLSRDGVGRDRRVFAGLAFYVRSHLLRMPPLMLARHLITKWRKGHRPL